MEKMVNTQLDLLLKERGLKFTRQRDEVVRAFLEAGSHLSAEELYQRVRRQNPRIGYATVYRTLRLLEENGWASSYQFGDRTARFERRAAGQHHDHLICRTCGKIVEFESARIEELQSRIADREGFQIFDHKLELYGTCAQCAHKRVGGEVRRRKREIG